MITHRRTPRALATLMLAAFALAGCSGLRLRLINASTRRPSNVAMYFTVDRSSGAPVPGLTAERFRIYEDGRPVSVLESRQTILNPQVAAVHYTLLLMDMSGSVTESGQVPQLQAAAQGFTSRVEQHQRVGVYAFDGSPTLYPIQPFSEGSGEGGVRALTGFHGRDPSTNLHGAIVEAVHTLEQALQRAPQPLKFGTLVVFTDGTDRANRVSQHDMLAALDTLNPDLYDVFAIGVGAEIDSGELHQIGRDGTVVEQNQAQVAQAFDQIAQRIEGYMQRYYLLGYCTPARAGEHEVRVEATLPDGASGSLEHRFNADGFGPNCDPNTPPNFDTSLRSHPRGADIGQPDR